MCPGPETIGSFSRLQLKYGGVIYLLFLLPLALSLVLSSKEFLENPVLFKFTDLVKQSQVRVEGLTR